jgi:hypothetical protein
MSQTKAQLLDNIKDNVQLDARNALRFADTDSSHYVAFKAPATISSNVTWTLPAADGSANYVLATDGSGTLSWIADPAGQWTTSGSNIYFTGGNVGIGDNSPSNPLSVTGASAFDGDVTFTGASYSVLWDKSADDLIFNDNAKAVFGTSSDGLEIFHNGSHSYIDDTGTGNLYIKSSGLWLRDSGNGGIQNGDGTENHIQWHNDGNVELYYDGSKKFETWSGGVTVTGNLNLNDGDKLALGNSGADLELFHGSNISTIKDNYGDLRIMGNTIRIQRNAGGENFLYATEGGKTSLYYDGSETFETIQYGAKAGGQLNLYHQSSNSYIKNDSGNLHIGTDGGTYIYGGKDFAEYCATFINDGAVSLYYDHSKKFETNDEGVKISGYLEMEDNQRIQMGTGDDLQLYHDGSNSFIRDVGTGLLVLTTSGFRVNNAANDENIIAADENGAVELYYDNSRKFSTNSTGCSTHGNHYFDDNQKILIGSGSDLQIYHDGSHSRIYNSTGNLSFKSSAYYFNNAAGTENCLDIIENGAVSLYYDHSKKFETVNVGTQVFGYLLIGSSSETNPAGSSAANGILACGSDGSFNGHAHNIQHKLGRNTDGTIVGFYSNGGAEGSVEISGSTTTYNTSSDYRLKENIVDLSDGITRLKQLQPRRFNFIKHPSVIKDGFIAHEVSSIVPEAVTGKKDAVVDQAGKDNGTYESGDKVGDPKYQKMDAAKLIPVLTAALQEAVTKIETLEIKVAALESA